MYFDADVILNLLIFLVTAVILVVFARHEGRWAPERIRKALRFFTCQSNMLCAAGALCTAVFRLSGNVPRWAWILKYTGTAAATVTMLTVFLFLWPSLGRGGLKRLLEKYDLFMHLLTPLAAIFSFCALEKQGMSFGQSLWGLVPVLLYGPLYLYKILYAPEGKRWDDFYGFNKQGKWPAAFGIMLAGTVAVCLGIMALQNL